MRSGDGYTRRMLSIRKLTKSYAWPRPRVIFRDLDLELGAGEYVAVMGESGSGKSTLLNLVAGLDRADGGSIVVDGTDLATLSDDALTVMRRRHLGFVFQAFHVLPYLTVAQNVALPLSLLGATPDAAAVAVDAMLADVGLADRAQSTPRELSGGELQRVAVARAVAHGPDLVLADEPTASLDTATGLRLLELLLTLGRERGCTTLIATHDPDVVRRADGKVELRDGRAV
jgi:putative ABC transport system ATP-binding protein